MLRVKDVDFARGQLTIRDPKWKHDRTTMLPAAVTSDLHEQLVEARLRQRRISPGGGARSGCRMRSPASCPPRRATRVGNRSFPPRAGGATATGAKAAIIYTRRWASVQ